MNMTRVSVLFVDLGNICRAPIAEILFLHLARQRGWVDRFLVDSCGTGDFHVGKSPDPRALKVLTRHGVSAANYSHTARQLQSADLGRFDYILCMDQLILGQVKQLACGPPTFVTPPTSSSSLSSSASNSASPTSISGSATTAAVGPEVAAHSVTKVNHSVADSLGGERQHSPVPTARCAIHLLGEFYHRKQLALNQKVDSKDFLISDPFYNPSEQPFEMVYEKCARYIDAFLDTFGDHRSSP